MRLLAILFTIALWGCTKDDSPAEIENRVFSKSMVLRSDCDHTSNFFWSWNAKTEIHGKTFYSLIYYRETLDRPGKSGIFKCENGLSQIISNEEAKNPIIDFLLTTKGELVQLRSVQSGELDNLAGFPLRQLYLDFLSSDFKVKKSLLYFDPTQANAVKYDSEGNEKPVDHSSKIKTLFFASHPTLNVGRIYSSGKDTLALSVINESGYRVALVNIEEASLISVHEIMPNTVQNFIMFDRTPAPLLVSDDGVISAVVQFSPAETSILKKRFGVIASTDSNSKHQILLSNINTKNNSRNVKVVSNESGVYPVDIKSDKNSIFILGNLVSRSNRTSELIVIKKATLVETNRFISPTPKMTASQTLETCNGKIFIGGTTGYHQVETGSIVEFGDAFLWTVDLLKNKSTYYQFGTDRHDKITNLFCNGENLIISGTEDGPITHTGDDNIELLYQRSFFGVWKK